MKCAYFVTELNGRLKCRDRIKLREINKLKRNYKKFVNCPSSFVNLEPLLTRQSVRRARVRQLYIRGVSLR